MVSVWLSRGGGVRCNGVGVHTKQKISFIFRNSLWYQLIWEGKFELMGSMLLLPHCWCFASFGAALLWDFCNVYCKHRESGRGAGKRKFSVINKNFLLSLPPPTTLDAVARPARPRSSHSESEIWDPHFVMNIPPPSPRPALTAPVQHPWLKINLLRGLGGILSSVTFYKKMWLHPQFKNVWAWVIDPVSSIRSV